jgi:DNA adenine methylase
MKSSKKNYIVHKKRRFKKNNIATVPVLVKTVPLEIPGIPAFTEKVNLEKVKPFLKWAGGKTQLLDTIIPRIPKKINNYIEPFIGAGSVLIAILLQLEKKNLTICGNIMVSDINPYLITCYQVISNADDCKKLLEKLKEYESLYLNTPIPPKKEKGIRRARNAPVSNSLNEAIEKNQEELYYYLRSQFIKLQSQYIDYKLSSKLEKLNNQESINYGILKDIYTPEQKIEVAVLMIFLNKTCWRGLYRESKQGLINVPYGNYYKVTICDCHLFNSLHYLFNKYNVKFILSDFNWFKEVSGNDDFIYMDPPYYPKEEGSFTNYQAEGFNLEKNVKLAECCHHLHQKGVKFLLSNSQTDFIKEKYQVYIKPGDILLAKRSINSKKPDIVTGEYLISNYN